MYRLVSILSLLMVSFSAWAQTQGITVSAVLEQETVEIGQPVKLLLEVEQPAVLKIQFPVFDTTGGFEQITENLEVSSHSSSDTLTASSDRISIHQTVVLQAFSLDTFTFSLAFIVYPSMDTLYTRPQTLIVYPVALDSTLVSEIDTAFTHKIFKEKNVIETPFTFQEFWYYTKLFLKKYGWLLLLVIALVVALIYYLKQRAKKKDAPITVVKPAIPAHVLALDRLDALGNQKMWQQGYVKEYQSELTGIIRQYIEDRYRMQAMEQTSDEIIMSFKINRLLEISTFEELQHMLRMADLVKFAKYQPLPDEHARSLELAYHFVKSTQKEEVTVPEEKAG